MIIAVDFDGTCVTEEFPRVGATIPNAVRVIKRIQKAGHKIVLWTVRGNYATEAMKPITENPLEDAIEWFRENDIELYGVNFNPDQFTNDSRKIFYDYLIDDRAIGTPRISHVNSEGKTQYCVNWNTIEVILEAQRII